MEQINLPEFLSLFGCSSVDDCWLNADCVIDESGIKAKHSDWGTINQATYLQKLRIDFPCTARQLFAWAKRLDKWEADYHNAEIQGHFIEKLPEDFIEKWKADNERLESWNFESGYMEVDIKEKIGTTPFDVDWTHWLTLSKWTKEQAALLVCGLEPNQFHQVETHADYQSMCKPLVMLLQRIPDDLPQPPFDWLNWFNENGYLDCVPKPLQVWFEQQSSTEPQFEAVGDAAGVSSNAASEPKERELTAWLRATWIAEGSPGGTGFFNKLKKYVNQKGSPILEHYSAGKAAGIRWQTSTGTDGTMAKKTIQTKVSIFKNTL